MVSRTEAQPELTTDQAARAFLKADRWLRELDDFPDLGPDLGLVFWGHINRRRRHAARTLIEAIERTGRPVFWKRHRFTLDPETRSLVVARTPRLRLLRRPEASDRFVGPRLVPAG